MLISYTDETSDNLDLHVGNLIELMSKLRRPGGKLPPEELFRDETNDA